MVRARLAAVADVDLLRTIAWAFAALFALVIAFRLALPKSLPFGVILLGLVIGSINALVAVGLILIYRANRIINFALAEVGVFGAIVFERLSRGLGVPWGLALLAGLASGAALAGILEYGIARRFASSPRLILTVATIGMAQVVTFGEVFLTRLGSGGAAVSGTMETPLSNIQVRIGGVVFDANALVLVAAVPLTVAIITVFLGRTDLGVAVRAAAENRDRASLLGVPVRRVSTAVWVVGGGLAALATMLRAPVVGLVAGGTIQGPGLLLRGLAAAVLARMENLHTAVIGALLLGVVEQSLFFGYSGTTVADAAFVAIMIVALLVQRRGPDRAADDGTTSFAEIDEVKKVPSVLRHLPEVRLLAVGAGVAVVGAVVTFPLVVSDIRVNLAAVIAIYAMVAVSLVVLTGWGGQISLGQFALVGIGAAVGGRLVADAHADFFVALLAAACAGAAVALLLGLASLRLRGYYFAVTSLGFAVATQTFFLNEKYFAALLPRNRPERPVLLSRFDLAGETAYYYVCVAMLGAVVLGVRALRGSRTGRVMIATRDNERAAQSYGVSPVRIRLLCFAVSGAIAGLAGGLFAVQQHDVSPSAFLPAESVLVFSMTVIGGLGSVPGAILGAIFVRGADVVFPSHFAALTSGAGLLVVLLMLPGGLGHVLFRVRDALLRRIADRRGIVVPSLVADARTSNAEDDDATAVAAYEAGRLRAVRLATLVPDLEPSR